MLRFGMLIFDDLLLHVANNFLASEGVNREEPVIREAAQNKPVTTNKRTETSKEVTPQ